MEKNLYIDASHPNETRIVLKSNNSIEEYEYEDKNNLNFKNNIYLASISRVEPSLQAAFVNFGRERHGFLAFNDIQSDYYQIPSEDKDKIRIAEEKIREELKDETINLNQESSRTESKEEKNQSIEESSENLEKKQNYLLLILLLSCVWLITDSTSSCQCIMHCELQFQFLDLSFIFFQ